MLGAWVATFVAIGVHIVVVMSGSAYLIAADQAEQWTRRELEPLRRGQWKVIHRVLFRQAEDIDHIALGPAGLFVIETKWSSNDWISSRQRARLLESIEQVRENARITRLFLRKDLGDVTATPVLVLWPSDGQMQEREIEGVTVLPGDQLTGWLRRRPTGALDDETVVRGWTAVAEHLSRRDAADLKRSGPPPRGVWEYLWDLVQLPLGTMTGVVACAWLATPLDWPLSLVPAVLLATVAGFAARSERVLRRLFQGVALGSGIVLFLLLAVAVLAIRPG
ncbi:MAG TPA: nuclease-related domain-containing protein, partial [Acidimicrobiales bacterium]|nr:nuclease-related domain-containing protein [Acidimicrobiales bacterium]